MKVRAYLRRSEAREGGESIDVQREKVAGDTAYRTWQLDSVEYVDDDESAFRDDLRNRPAMRQALEDAKHHRFDVLAVYKYDRLARDEAVYFYLLRHFQKANVKVVSATESDDPLARALSGVLAAEYSRILSRRMRDVRQWDAKHGRLVGLPPRGYDRGPGRIPIPNQDAPMVQQLGELYATGTHSAARLAAQFGLHTDAVHGMLSCPVYAGFIACGNELYQGQHQAIWPAELWARIQAVREERSKRRGRAITATPGLLTGRLICANCGAPLWAHSRDRYRCSTLATKQPGPIDGLVCVGGVTYARSIEQSMIAMLSSLAYIPGLLREVEQAILATPHQTTMRRQRDDRAMARLKTQFMQDEISAQEYERRKQALEAERLTDSVSVVAPDPEVARALLFNLSGLIQAATPDELRPVVRELVTEVYARKHEVIAIRPTVIGSAIFEAATARGDEWLNQMEHGAGSPPGPLLTTSVKRLPVFLPVGVQL